MTANHLDFEISFFESLIKDKPDFVDALIPLAEAYTRKGLYEKGLELDRRLVKLRGNDPIIHYNLGCSYALLGLKDKAFRALSDAICFGYSDAHHLSRDADLKSLQSDPRFAELIRSLRSL